MTLASSPRRRLFETVVSRSGEVLPGELALPISTPSAASYAFAVHLFRTVPPAALARQPGRWADSGAQSIPGIHRHCAVGAAFRAHGWVHLPGPAALPYAEALRHMVAALRLELAEELADGNSAQSFTDQYCILHEETYGRPFTPPADG
jgi:hypothetical protein